VPPGGAPVPPGSEGIRCPPPAGAASPMSGLPDIGLRKAIPLSRRLMRAPSVDRTAIGIHALGIKSTIKWVVGQLELKMKLASYSDDSPDSETAQADEKLSELLLADMAGMAEHISQ
jgi:hypothetical protein